MRFFAAGGVVFAIATVTLVTPSLAAQPTAIRNVTVIDVAAGRRVREHTVLIDGGRIVALGDAGSIALPPGTRVIDGRGKYLIPGMWDMHVHLGMGGQSALALLVANGVLGVRDMGDSFERIKAWRDSTAAGSLFGPRIEMVGPMIENAQWLTRVISMLNQQGQTENAFSLGERIGVSTPDEARAAAAHLREMDSSGVVILAGTDLGGPLIYPGFGLHDELSRMVREGAMPPARVLRAATLNAAQFLGLENELGTVARGMRADLVLLSADPLADIANVGRIEAVIGDGKVYDRIMLDQVLRGVANSR